MKRFGSFAAMTIGVVLAFCAVSYAAAVDNDLKYLGYSDEIASYAVNSHAKTHKVDACNSAVCTSNEACCCEECQAGNFCDCCACASDTKSCKCSCETCKCCAKNCKRSCETCKGGRHCECAACCAASKSVSAKGVPAPIVALRNKLDKFWNEMHTVEPMACISPELRETLKTALTEALTSAGYNVQKLDLIDAAPNMGNPQVRAVIRVTKPVASQNSYREIQNNLAQIKELCVQACTINNVRYLSELTTFIAVNPRNKYYYEKTILNF